MDTTTIRHRGVAVVVAAGIAVGFPSVAIAGPQPVANTTSTVRPCFIIQSHWNPAYDGFVPECDRPR